MYKESAEHHPALQNGFDLCLETRHNLTEEQWKDCCLFAAAAVQPCTTKMFDDLKKTLQNQNLLQGEARNVTGRIGGDALQVNLGFALSLSEHGSVANPMFESLSLKLVVKLELETFDFGQVLRRVEGYKDLLSPHLGRVAAETLNTFEFDKDFKLLIQNLKRDQTAHLDNEPPGSLFNVVVFGCGNKGERHTDDVPCTHVCKYDNMARITMKGEGWPLIWRDLPASTPKTVGWGASICVPANNIHWGVGVDEESAFPLRCSFFRMARHPTCKQFFDKKVTGGDLQLFEWSHLWDLGEDDLMCESLTHRKNRDWRRTYTKPQAEAMEVIIQEWRERTRREKRRG